MLLLLSSGCTVVDNNNTEYLSAQVVRVIDGDTLQVNINGKKETIRLLLVDTPETVHPSKPIQPFGLEASQFMKERLSGKQVKVELDINERDKYGRLLAYIYVNNEMVNKQLLEKGLARVAYVFEPNTKYVDEFYQVQKTAQKQGIGIWSIENYSTEEGLVEGEKTDNSNAECKIKGNINSKGEKIFHTESSPSYEVTKAEEMFCNESEALEAGYRAIKK